MIDKELLLKASKRVDNIVKYADNNLKNDFTPKIENLAEEVDRKYTEMVQNNVLNSESTNSIVEEIKAKLKSLDSDFIDMSDVLVKGLNETSSNLESQNRNLDSTMSVK